MSVPGWLRIFATGLALTAGASEAAVPEKALGISANPGAINQTTGTGLLGRLVGLKEDSGVFLGGVWVGDANFVISGGADPQTWSFNSLFILSLGLDSEKLVGWKGGKFGIEFLQFNGQKTNQQAGSAQGYNSLPGPEPLNRSELYQLWWRQAFFDEKLVVRVGKMVPTNDFGNVLRPVPTQDETLAVPAVSGLAFTPVFVNPTALGVMPGYYNSTSGVTTTIAPTKNLYFNYGFYDGNIANNNTQTGMLGPQFNGYYFHIWEAGDAWEIPAGRAGKLPGSFAVGLWHQTGELRGPGVTENGATGVYLFGSQRLWLKHPGRDNAGVSAFFQFGANDSQTLPCARYFGGGLTAFGLVPGRALDSAGLGVAWSKLNPREFSRDSELMFQGYYQVHLVAAAYLQPVVSYIPTPGLGADLGGAWAATMRLTVLF